jgi:hypothetical protein
MNGILLANLSGQMMLLLATVIATGLLMRRIARRSGAARSEPLPSRAGKAKTATAHFPELPSATTRRQVEMYELARDVQGELDSKMRVLQVLIDEARRESDRLEELLAEVGAAEAPRERAACSAPQRTAASAR